MSTPQELFEAVRARTAGTPYVVEETAEGFDVRLDHENPQWYGQLREWRATRVTTCHVQVLAVSRAIRITDEIRTLTWVAGTDGRERPTLGATLAVDTGQVKSWGVRRTYSLARSGITKESEVSYDASPGRDLVLEAAKPLGWKLERTRTERGALYIGVGTIVLLVLAGIGVGIAALAGAFSS